MRQKVRRRSYLAAERLSERPDRRTEAVAASLAAPEEALVGKGVDEVIGSRRSQADPAADLLDRQAVRRSDFAKDRERPGDRLHALTRRRDGFQLVRHRSG